MYVFLCSMCVRTLVMYVQTKYFLISFVICNGQMIVGWMYTGSTYVRCQNIKSAHFENMSTVRGTVVLNIYDLRFEKIISKVCLVHRYVGLVSG